MPNHCHVMIELFEGIPLGKIVLSWKNYTARFINEYRNAALGCGDPERSIPRSGSGSIGIVLSATDATL